MILQIFYFSDNYFHTISIDSESDFELDSIIEFKLGLGSKVSFQYEIMHNAKGNAKCRWLMIPVILDLKLQKQFPISSKWS